MHDSVIHVIWTAILLGVVSAIVSLLLTRLLLCLLPKWGMVDKPDFARHIHTHAIPRGGGLAIFVSFATLLLLYTGFHPPIGKHACQEGLRLLTPLFILIPLGVIDDRIGLKARTKFLFQILAAAIAWKLDYRLAVCFGYQLPSWLCLPLTILWIVCFINAFNMIDGVDGLASGIGIISATCLATIALIDEQRGFTVVMAIFAGALLGFLRYNWNPARVFMGDTGSMFIGYILAVSGLTINARLASVASIGVPLLACGIPLLDIMFAVWRRILGTEEPQDAQDHGDALANGDEPAPSGSEDSAEKTTILSRCASLVERLGTADQKHVHHRHLNYFDRNQKKTVWSIYALAAGMGAIGIGCCFFPENRTIPALVIILYTFSFIINHLAFIELWRTAELAYGGFQSARTGIILTYIINPLADLLFIGLAYFLAFASENQEPDISATLRYVGIIICTLICSSPYRVFWNFAVSDDYFRLIRTIVFGFLIAWASDFIFQHTSTNSMHAYAASTAIFAIMMERLGLHYIRNWQARRFGSSSLNKTTAVRSIIVGITPLTRFYRNRLLSNIEQAGHEQIVGILAQDRHFLHSYCFGMKVTGTLDDAERVIPESGATRVVVTAPIPDNFKERLQKICLDNGIALYSFYAVEEPVCLPSTKNQ